MQCAGASCETLQAPSNLAQIFCGLETNLLHTDAFPQREGCLYKGLLLHRDAFHKDTLLHGRLHIQMLLPWDPFTHKYLYTQAPLHRYVFTQRNFYTGILLTEYPLHTEAFTHTHTRTLTQRVNFAQKYIYAEAFFSTQIARRYFTKRCFSTSTFNAEMSLHRGAFRLGRL